ncbi:MAG: ABC transporter ATP-binding protein [Thermoanaerobaculia bacterium]
MAELAIELEKLSVRRGTYLAVDAVDLSVEPGSIVALVGASGCGKTSLLRAIAGLERPTAGAISIDGVRVSGPGRWVEPEGRCVGMVFQEAALFPHLDVWRNILFGVHRLSDADHRAQSALDLVGLSELRARFPNELSGGQQHRVALARALAPSPKLILLDEPFAALDAGLRERVRAEVQEILESSGTTALLVTHDQQEALSFATTVAVMHQGKVLQSGPPEEIYFRPNCEEVAEIIGAGFWVECEVTDGRFDCRFGSGACNTTCGEGKVFIRPGDFLLVEADRFQKRCGTLENRKFFGHEVTYRIRLDDGERVEVRSLATIDLELGSRYHLELREGSFQVLPRSSQSL